MAKQTIPTLPSKLSQSISDYPGVKGRNIIQTDLQILSEVVIEDLIKSRELEDTFLKECYCQSGALSQYSLTTKTILEARYDALFSKNESGPTLVPATTKRGVSKDLLAESLSRRPIPLPRASHEDLKPGGRAGLVLPDGTLFGEGVKTRIKEALLTDCNLHTVVRLPNGVFNPYTGIRTNLLFFTKGQPTTEVWYYEHPYPPGAKSYNKGKPIRIEEFQPEREWWDRRVENEQAWRISIDQIKAGNYNLDLKNPHNPDVGPGDVDHLLPAYEKLLAQIAETRATLKQELHSALMASIGDAE